MDAETREELENQVSVYRAVDETIKTAGWKKWLVPRFERLKQVHLNTLTNSRELPDVIRAQEAIKAIDMFFDDIKLCISEGKEAVETLAKEKE